jgi:hypothetical protein
MKARRTGYTAVAAAMALAALVAVIGAAQAAPSTKVYDATVRVMSGPVPPAPATATLRLTLTNSTRSKQTLGSANFTAGTGITLGTPTATSRPQQWTAVKQGANVVAFRSTVALKPGELVFADVAVTTSASCSASWTTHVKQSNDFSGSGNDFAPGTSSNLRPLGSFTIADIGTLVDDPATTDVVEEVFVPQIKLSPPNDPTRVDISADDICGADYVGYGSTFGTTDSTLEAKAPPPPPQRLEGATISPIDWTNPGGGSGSATIEPVIVETGDQVVVTDVFSGISRTSNEFDVVEKICTSFDDTCHWSNANNKIHVDASVVHPGASLGIGFIGDESFSCSNGDDALGSTLIYINPRDYEPTETQSVMLTYDKTVPGSSGNVSSFDVCISKDNGENWSSPIPNCASDPPVSTDPTPCVEDRGRSNGDLFVVLFLNPTVDPLGGMT